MKKSRLIAEYGYNFELFGINSPVRDYKLAWLINNALDIHMIKVDDLEIEYSNQASVITSHFLHRTAATRIRLLKNKSYGEEKKPLLIPELPNFDFFLIVEDETETLDLSEILDTLRNLDLIQYIQPLKIDKLKSKENLIL